MLFKSTQTGLLRRAVRLSLLPPVCAVALPVVADMPAVSFDRKPRNTPVTDIPIGKKATPAATTPLNDDDEGLIHTYEDWLALATVGKRGLTPLLEPSDLDSDTPAKRVLEEIVVTGTRTEQAAIDSPVKVEVINARTIERQHARDIAEALKTAPGVQLHDVSGKQGQEVVLQGIGADRVLVLIDSEPVAASTGSAVDVTQVSAAGVERIEIVKGATSVLYGSNAIGGVLNIITAQPKLGWHGKFAFDLGSYGDQNPSGNTWQMARQRTDAQLSYGGELFNFSAGVNARFSDGFQVDPDQVRNQGESGHRINSHLDFGFMLDDESEYEFGYERYDQELRADFLDYKPGLPAPLLKLKEDDVVRERYTGRGIWRWDDGEAIFRAYHESFVNTSVPDGVSNRTADLDSNKASLQINQQAWENQVWTLGVDYFAETLMQDKDGISELDRPQESREAFEAYAQDEIEIGNLTLLPGVRWQYDSDFGAHAVPAVNGRYDFIDDGDWQIFMRGGIGQGYRVANLKERYFVFDHSQIGYKILGNPDLKPESSVSYQLGFVVANLNHFQLDINLFRNDLTDLIETEVAGYVEDAANPHVLYSYVNVAKARTQGVEVSAQYWPVDSLSLRLGYQYLDAKNQSSGYALNNRPRNQITASVDYQTPFGMDLILINRWFDEQPNYELNSDTGALVRKFITPSYTALDLKVNQDVGAGVSLYGGVDNILDAQRNFDFEQLDQRPITGRLFYVGFQYDF
ncbi:Colicin I receptor [BD1-7 clade bacterium]|uniref:Colicin I receptor n=1 Tax=BD1-7 clade bacterium TaxID=2029982 RepID=A0A5S9MZM5_9GAMM|nr:Colicin I receptor [BD1-7 clade bacterium]